MNDVFADMIGPSEVIVYWTTLCYRITLLEIGPMLGKCRSSTNGLFSRADKCEFMSPPVNTWVYAYLPKSYDGNEQSPNYARLARTLVR